MGNVLPNRTNAGQRNTAAWERRSPDEALANTPSRSHSADGLRPLGGFGSLLSLVLDYTLLAT